MQSKLLSMKFSMILIICLFVFSLFGIEDYAGSSLQYYVFDFIWLTLLISCLSFRQNYVLFFLKLMLFLGVWLKFMFYLVLGVKFVEPTGYWKYIDVGNLHLYWDRVLMIASYAALGILAADFMFFIFCRFYYKKSVVSLTSQVESSQVPQWYIKHPNKIWILILCLSLILSCINFATHFYMTGLVPTVIFPYHLNLILTGFMVFFLPLSIGYLMGLDGLSKNFKHWYYAIIITCIITITALSRSILVLWMVPCFFIIFKENFHSLFTQHKKLISVYVISAIISLVTVSILRGYYFYGKILPAYSTSSMERNTKLNINIQLNQLLTLPVGRWIGMEGILATTSYPDAGWELFKHSNFQKPSAEKTSLYSEISLSYLNLSKGLAFSSLPGLIGVLNYSNHGLIVGLGTFIICFILSIVQFCFHTKLNIYFLSQQGFLMAYFLTELNVPYLGVVNFSEFILASFLLLLIHRLKVSPLRIGRKSNLNRNSLGSLS